jgi:hypothetical protein
VASNAGIFYHCGVRAGAAFDITTTCKAIQHSALWTMMGTPVGTGNFNVAIGIWFSNRAAWLVAVGAQVALAAVVGYVFKS